jgi:transforming growth factor-beta-induced protein
MRRYLILATTIGFLGLGACESDDSEESATTEGDSGTPTGENQTTAGSGGRAGSGAGGRGGAGGRAPTDDKKDAGSEETPSTGGRGGSGGKAGSGGSAGEEPTTSADAGPADAADIVDTAVAAGNFKQLAAALTKANLVDALKGEGPFTVFAPTDAAFDALEQAKPGTVAGLTDAQLVEVLQYHVVAGAAVKAADLKNGQLVKTLAGPVAAIDLSGAKPTINGVTISTTDIVASNGIIHVIDAVLLPPGDIVEVATAAGSFTKLAEALTTAGLVDDLQGEGPFTVFAPTDAAFEKLSAAPTGDALTNVLLYHVLQGAVGPADLKEGGAAKTLAGSPVLFTLAGGAKINDASITTTNVVAKNGVIHVIDTVIVPPADDIVATAIAAGTFTQLANALTSADLVSALQADGPFTVFAPTDEAFGALAEVPTGDALKNVLLYHVVEGAIGSGDLTAGAVPTLSTNNSLTIDLTGGVKVNDATVTTANILTKNGIIHVVDKVLVPN